MTADKIVSCGYNRSFASERRGLVNIPLHQQIYSRYLLHPAYHMTHINNLASIISGGIKSYNQMRGLQYQNIANDDVQAGRATITVDVTGRPLHDYVPLYFGFKTPMVACNQNINNDLIFLRFSLDILEQPGVVFSDGNARSHGTSFYLFHDIGSLSVLNVKAIHTVKYAGDNELRRQKQAEVLVPDSLHFSQAIDIFVFSEDAKNRVMAILLQYGRSKRVVVQPVWYFKS